MTVLSPLGDSSFTTVCNPSGVVGKTVAADCYRYGTPNGVVEESDVADFHRYATPDGFQSITNAVVGRPLGLRAESACYTRQTIRNSSEKRVIPSWMR